MDYQKQKSSPSYVSVNSSTTTSTFGIQPRPKQPPNHAAARRWNKCSVSHFVAETWPRLDGIWSALKASNSSRTFGRRYFLIIKSLKLDNFRSFSQARLDFVPGQNYIFGQNWQGKSSVVDAIGFALFGVDIFPKKVAGTAVSSDHLVNEGSKRGSVELRFELDGCEYSLHRSLPGRQVSLK